MTANRPNTVRITLVVLALAAGFVGLTLSDHWIWVHFRVANFPSMQLKDWYQFFRQFGTLYLWAAGAIMLLLHDLARWKQAPRAAPVIAVSTRALLLFLSAGLGGAASELLLVTIRRLRPTETGGEYLFAWMHGVPHGPYGMPSSHAGVAFGAVFMIARLFPPVGPVVIALACVCALTRLVSGAHFVTDVYVAAIVGYAVAAGLWRLPRKSLDTQLPAPGPA